MSSHLHKLPRLPRRHHHIEVSLFSLIRLYGSDLWIIHGPELSPNPHPYISFFSVRDEVFLHTKLLY